VELWVIRKLVAPSPDLCRCARCRGLQSSTPLRPLQSTNSTACTAWCDALLIDLSLNRAEAGRILLTSSGHSGVSTEDRVYLVQQVAAATGVSAADAKRRSDNAIADARTAIARSRRTSIILPFSVAACLRFGAVAAWVAATAGGRHRDGAPLPNWIDKRSTTANKPAA
jgi:hypothetical protein